MQSNALYMYTFNAIYVYIICEGRGGTKERGGSERRERGGRERRERGGRERRERGGRMRRERREGGWGWGGGQTCRQPAPAVADACVGHACAGLAFRPPLAARPSTESDLVQHSNAALRDPTARLSRPVAPARPRPPPPASRAPSLQTRRDQRHGID